MSRASWQFGGAASKKRLTDLTGLLCWCPSPDRWARVWSMPGSVRGNDKTIAWSHNKGVPLLLCCSSPGTRNHHTHIRAILISPSFPSLSLHHKYILYVNTYALNLSILAPQIGHHDGISDASTTYCLISPRLTETAVRCARLPVMCTHMSSVGVYWLFMRSCLAPIPLIDSLVSNLRVPTGQAKENRETHRIDDSSGAFRHVV